MLLDVQPVPENVTVEILAGGEAFRLGEVDCSALIERVVRARAARERFAAGRGLYLEHTVTYECFDLSDSVQDWIEHRKQRGSTSIVTDELLERARRELAMRGGRLRLRERHTIWRYRRSHTPPWERKT